MKLHLINGMDLAEELEEIERKAKIAWENIWLEVADQLRTASMEKVAVHKKIVMDEKECILKVAFEAHFPQKTDDGEIIRPVVYTGYEIQK